MGIILAAMMRQMKRKRAVVLPPELLTVPGVQVDYLEDGSVRVDFIKPNPNGHKDLVDDQSTEPIT